jgi:hypothetical protein
MIPEAAKEPVARALREAFGVTEFEDIQMMTAGLMYGPGGEVTNRTGVIGNSFRVRI